MDYSYIFKLLSLPDDGSISIDNVEVAGDTKYVYISRPPIPTYCPNCSCRMLLKASIREKSNTLFYRILPALSLSLARESGNAPPSSYSNNPALKLYNYDESRKIVQRIRTSPQKGLQYAVPVLFL